MRYRHLWASRVSHGLRFLPSVSDICVKTASFHPKQLFSSSILPHRSRKILAPFRGFATTLRRINIRGYTGHQHVPRKNHLIFLDFMLLVLDFEPYYCLLNIRTCAKLIIYLMIAFQPPLIALQSSFPARDDATLTSSS